MVETTLDETHDIQLRSWVESANQPDGDFPIQNLPLGVFERLDSRSSPSIGIAIGDLVLDLSGCRTAGLLDALPPVISQACGATSLLELMALGPAPISQLRLHVSRLLRGHESSSEVNRRKALPHLVEPNKVRMVLPCQIGDYSDFYASIHHAGNVGKLFRPDNPLLPNYKYVPIGYHGRASSIVPSGTPVTRPRGQIKMDNAEVPSFVATASLDYELEVGFFNGAMNPLGSPVTIDEAESHIFGFCLLNDWSARDIQAWEYQPLGPFLGKSFATSISPWIVTLDALAPFRAPSAKRTDSDPQPLPYLSSAPDAASGAFDLKLEVLLSSQKMRESGADPVCLGRANLRDLYWTPAQMLTHHTSNGCNLRPGDLLATGTVSGALENSRGSLLELTGRGRKPFTLPSGEIRGFLADGDEVIMHAYCERSGFARIGFGECRGIVLPAEGSVVQ
jgi:fumarylacetoacetase